ncbi:MAG: hypothetical protein ACOC80_14415 [Petrotogales bacterium]
MRVKEIDGIPFYFYSKHRTKKAANVQASRLRNQGYYARVFGSRSGIEVWVSKNPRWFYKLGNFKF